jgi:ABC-2 type transport system permease protein
MIQPIPITRLTLRQFARAKTLLVLAGIALIPAIFAIIGRIAGNTSTREIRTFVGNDMYRDLFSATLLPIMVLVVATAAIGDEIEDHTLQYLTLKPISRLRIVLEKFVGVLVTTIPLCWLGMMIATAIISWGQLDDVRDLIWPMTASIIGGAVAFGSVFMLLSLFIQRALLAGLFYTFVWESALSRFLPGIRAISLRHYTQSIFTRLADDRLLTLTHQAALNTAIITIAVICVLSLALATWRIRTMNQE